MGWIVQGSKESAKAAGADPEGDRVMFAITPNSVAEVYNRYRKNVDESELGFEDQWGLLSDEQREGLLNAIEGYIDKRLCNIDEDLIDELDGAEAGRPPEPWHKTPDCGKKEIGMPELTCLSLEV